MGADHGPAMPDVQACFAFSPMTRAGAPYTSTVHFNQPVASGHCGASTIPSAHHRSPQKLFQKCVKLLSGAKKKIIRMFETQKPKTKEA